MPREHECSGRGHAHDDAPVLRNEIRAERSTVGSDREVEVGDVCYRGLDACNVFRIDGDVEIVADVGATARVARAGA